MYQKITRKKSNDCSQIVKNQKKTKELGPRRETLAFVMQFASVYHVEKKLPDSISGLVLN